MRVNNSWADISILVGGVALIECTEIDYGRERNMEDHYGVGDKVVSRGYGNVKDSGLTVKLSLDEFKRLEAAAPNGDITLYPQFVINLVWKANPFKPEGTKDVLYNVQFMKYNRPLKQGETKHYVSIDCIFAGLNDPQ